MKNFEHICQLIRAALGQPYQSLPADVDWQDLFSLSERQGVNGLCLDGLARMDENAHASGTNPQEHDPQSLWYRRMQWMGIAMKNEQKVRLQREVLHMLIDGLANECGIQDIVVLKGFTIARLWPVPTHRPCCDIDIYTGTHRDRVDEWVRSKGCSVEGEGRHTHFHIQGVNVENHCIFLSNSKPLSRIENYLQQAPINQIPGMPGAYQLDNVPNSIFNLCHLSGHFQEYESISLRHLVDWALLLSNAPAEEYRRQVQELSLTPANDLLTTLAIQLTGMPLQPYLIHPTPTIQKDAQRALSDILRGKQHRTAHISDWPRNLLLIFRNRWKFRYTPTTFTHRLWKSIASKFS